MTRPPRRFLALIPLLGACSGDTGPTSELLGSASEVISAEAGGVLEVEGATLEIPAGALSENTEITLSVYANDPTLPDAENTWGQVYVLEPHGLEFDQPVVFTTPAFDPLPIEQLSDVVLPYQGLAYLNDETGGWELQPQDLSPGESVAYLSHFSTFVTYKSGNSFTTKIYPPEGTGPQFLELLEDGFVDLFLAFECNPKSSFTRRKPTSNGMYVMGSGHSCTRFNGSLEHVDQLEAALANLTATALCTTLVDEFTLDDINQWEADASNSSLCLDDQDESSKGGDLGDYLASLDDSGDCANTLLQGHAATCQVERICETPDLKSSFVDRVRFDGNFDQDGASFEGVLVQEFVIGNNVDLACSYTVDSKEPEAPTVFTEDLITGGGAWTEHSEGFSHTFSINVDFDGPNTAEFYVNSHYLTSGSTYYTPHATWTFNGDQTFTFSDPEVTSGSFPVSGGVVGMSCEYCERDSTINDCNSYDFVIPDGFSGQGLMCTPDNGSAFSGDYAESIRFFR